MMKIARSLCYMFKFKRPLGTLLKTVNLSEINLVGRDFIDPNNLSSPEIKSILWTAMDLKCLAKQRTLKVDSVKEAKISLILNSPCIQSQLSIMNAAKLLNTSVNIVVDCSVKKYVHVTDYGRAVAANSDMIFCLGQGQDEIEKIADGSNVPVIAIKSHDFSLVKFLSDAMTLQCYFDYLKGLTVAYVGTTGSVINTYMCMLPQVGINLRYCCASIEPVSPALMPDCIKFCQQHNTEMRECCSVEEAVYRSDVVATSCHNELSFQVTSDLIGQAAVKWALLHELPRGHCDVDNEVFEHKNCLVWQSIANSTWIYAALILRFLASHSHCIEEPNFDKTEC